MEQNIRPLIQEFHAVNIPTGLRDKTIVFNLLGVKDFLSKI